MSMGSIDAVTMAPRTLNAADAQGRELNQNQHIYDPVSYTHLDVYKRQVYGMPRAVVQAGIVNEVVPLEDVADTMIKHIGV